MDYYVIMCLYDFNDPNIDKNIKNNNIMTATRIESFIKPNVFLALWQKATKQNSIWRC